MFGMCVLYAWFSVYGAFLCVLFKCGVCLVYVGVHVLCIVCVVCVRCMCFVCMMCLCCDVCVEYLWH